MSVCLLLVLWWFVLGALEKQAQRATEMSAKMVLTQLRSALVIRGAEVMLDRGQSLASQEGINPFELIDHQWPSYQGNCGGQQPEQNHWCFRVRAQKETAPQLRGWLIYNPGQPLTIDGRQALPGEPLAWQVAVAFSDNNGNGIREQEEGMTGLVLAPVIPKQEGKAL